MKIKDKAQLQNVVEKAIEETPITDIHTHLYNPVFKDLLLWGIDELLAYHYLAAETMVRVSMDYYKYFSLSKREQADIVWDTLFIKNSPVSEASRGVLTVLKNLGLDVEKRDLASYRTYFESYNVQDYISKVLKTANVKELIMTNDPFDDRERKIWLSGEYKQDPRFKTSLRIDPLINAWERTWPRLKEWGYDVEEYLNEKTCAEVRRFLTDWVKRMDALFLACSVPPSFAFPEDSSRGKILEKCILPVCLELDKPFQFMIGRKAYVNPGLGDASFTVGHSDISALEYLCVNYPKNKFITSFLSRENQHEVCVVARKFRNLMLFGCWWFLNNPVFINEMTRMRMEMLGLSFIPQHSDARVLDQLLYKWPHSKAIIKTVLIEKYGDIYDNGWDVSEDEIKRDVASLFGGYFYEFLNRKL